MQEFQVISKLLQIKTCGRHAHQVALRVVTRGYFFARWVIVFFLKRHQAQNFMLVARLEWVYSSGMRNIRSLTILIVSLPLLFSSVSTAQAACNTYDNGLGGQSGTCNGERVNTYGNGLGGVSGTIGKSRINTYDNGLGGVSGTIGKSRINTYDNGLGGVSGTVGNSRINTYGNGLGGVSGTIGKSRINTYDNGLGGVSGTGIGGVPGITKSTKKCLSSFTKKC